MGFIEEAQKLIQDLIVPEFRAVQSEVSQLREDVRGLRQDFGGLRQDMSGLKESIAEGFAEMSGKFDNLTYRLDVTEKMNVLEQRLARIEEHAGR